MASFEKRLTLTVLAGTYAVSRFDSKAQIPEWAAKGGTFLTISRTDEELSIVSEDGLVPNGIRSERGWCCLRVHGPLDFATTGVLSSISSCLSERNISVFAISTYDTDYFLLKHSELSRACEALDISGHTVKRSDS